MSLSLSFINAPSILFFQFRSLNVRSLEERTNVLPSFVFFSFIFILDIPYVHNLHTSFTYTTPYVFFFSFYSVHPHSYTRTSRSRNILYHMHDTFLFIYLFIFFKQLQFIINYDKSNSNLHAHNKIHSNKNLFYICRYIFPTEHFNYNFGHLILLNFYLITGLKLRVVTILSTKRNFVLEI
jgi:hypothetical protein